MHCSLVAASMTLNTIVARLRGARLSRFKSIVASSTSARRPCHQALKLGSQSLFSQSLKFMLEPDLGVGNKKLQNDPKINTEMCQEILGAMRWGVTDQDTGHSQDLYFRNEPMIREPLVNQPLGFHLNCLSQKSHNCPLFLGSKNQGHISEDPI